MSAREHFDEISKASNKLILGRLLNNILGFLGLAPGVYLIWWRWELGWLGILAFLGWFLVLNAALLPTVFKIYNKPLAEKAKNAAVTLATMKIISEQTVQSLAGENVENWPKVILSSMTPEEYEEKLGGK